MTWTDGQASRATGSTPSDDLPLRLFIALPVPPVVRAEIEGAIEAVSERVQVDGLRWVRPEAWHLTLTFCGSVPLRRVDELRLRLARAAARAQPLRLAIGRAGRFGAQVLWADVGGDREPLRRLAASTTAAARRSGIAVSDRPYRPHLTLARSDGRADLRALVTELADLGSSPWTAEELVLVGSSLGAGAGGTAQHDVLDRWSLGRPGDGGSGSAPTASAARPLTARG